MNMTPRQRRGPRSPTHRGSPPGVGRLAHARASVREAIELHLDIPDNQSLEDVGVVVQDQVVVPGVDTGEIVSLQQRRARSELLRSEVARDTERLVGRLLEQGLSTRDAGTVVGVSGGRVSQYRKQAR